MAKKKIEKMAVELRKLLTDKKLVIGTDRVLKHIKSGKLKQVYIASNCADSTKEDVLRYCKLAKTDVKELAYLSADLGVFCKKPFSISVIGVLK